MFLPAQRVVFLVHEAKNITIHRYPIRDKHKRKRGNTVKEHTISALCPGAGKPLLSFNTPDCCLVYSQHPCQALPIHFMLTFPNSPLHNWRRITSICATHAHHREQGFVRLSHFQLYLAFVLRPLSFRPLFVVSLWVCRNMEQCVIALLRQNARSWGDWTRRWRKYGSRQNEYVTMFPFLAL